MGVSLTGDCGADFSGIKNDVSAFDTGGICCATSVCVYACVCGCNQGFCLWLLKTS